MATTTRTTDDHDLINIPTLDELDRMAGLVRPASNKIDPQARLKLRLAAHQELTAQREAVAQQGVRR